MGTFRTANNSNNVKHYNNSVKAIILPFLLINKISAQFNSKVEPNLHKRKQLAVGNNNRSKEY